MYSVSASYLEAVKRKDREDSIVGAVRLANGEVIPISDRNIVRNSLKLTKELCGSSYRIGTFCLSCLQISFFDSGSVIRDYSGAMINLYYRLKVGSGTETVPLGLFIADGSAAKRVRSRVTLTAYDNGIRFDEVPSESVRALTAKPYDIISAVCGQCGVTLAADEEKLDGMPNGETEFSPSSAQIQTCRDIIMWCADILCGYAVIDRNGRLDIIPAKYSVSEENSSIITEDRRITEAERKSISVTDTRAYIKYLTGYSGGKVKSYSSQYTAADEQAFPAVYEMRANPLLSGKSEDECDEINRSWLSYIGAFKQRGVTAEIYGDPAIDLGDTIRFSGGDIDQRRSIVGLVTGIEWRYRRYENIVCRAAVCCDSVPYSSANTPRAGNKTQSEKRMDAISVSSKGVGENIGNFNERFNDYENNIAEGGAYNFIAGRNNTVDNGWGNMVGGDHNYVTGSYNLVCGEFLKACGPDQIVCGKYNEIDGGAVFIVGNGFDDDRRSNALTVSQSGVLTAAGNIRTSGSVVSGSVICEGTGSFNGGIYIPLGDGLKNTYTSEDGANYVKPAVKISDGLDFETDNSYEGAGKFLTLKIGDGLDYEGERTEPENGRALTLKQATSSEIGGIKLGDGLSYNANSDKTGLVKASSTTLGGLILGEGLNYNETTGKVDVTGGGGSGLNIEHAVVIRPADSAFLLHDYTEVEYIENSRIGFAGPANQIIVNGYIFYKAVADIIALGSAPYTAAHFAKCGTGLTNMVENVDFYVNPQFSATSPAQFAIAAPALNRAGTKLPTYDVSRSGMGFTWGSIFPPTEDHPYGYVYATVWQIYKSSATAATLTSRNDGTLYIDFASAEEYGAAVGLTYEPQTLYRFTDNVTEV